MKTPRMEKLPEETLDKEIAELRERVIRLEVQLSEMNKRIESLSSYTRQLYEYLNRLSR
jgi:predicted nuclease with TOPRIM domain